MIAIYLLVFLLAAAGILWLSNVLKQYPELVTITWADYTTEITTSRLIAGILITLVAFYIFFRLLKHLLSMGKYIRAYRHKRHCNKAQNELMQGLVLLTEGDWAKAEQQLLNHVEYSEIPVLNYLAAARVAHMQEKYTRRDQHLKRASEQADDAKIAIAVSQAEMQLHSEQYEQARATLINLLEHSPRHTYARKLLAKTYFRQEDWKNLAILLQELGKVDGISEDEYARYEAASLKGIFQMYANEEGLGELKTVWKKLPATIRNKNASILLYCKALITAGDSGMAGKLLSKTLNKNWDEALVELYGNTSHDNLNAAIQQAEKWLEDHDNSPLLLLTLARLYRNNQLWGKARHFYESSLNLAPHAKGYLEFAELLEQIGEKENANICYQQGLRYCINKKGKPISLKHMREARHGKTPPITVENREIYSV
jgi:HemY protein